MTSLREPASERGISDCRWFLISMDDWRKIAPARKLELPLSKFFQAISPQTVFYKPGSLAEYFRLAEAFSELGSNYPTALQAKTVYETVLGESALYRFSFNDEHWEIVNIHNPTFFLVFQAELYVFCAVKGGNLLRYPINSCDLPHLFTGIQYLHEMEQNGLSVLEHIGRVSLSIRPLVLELVRHGYLADSVPRMQSPDITPQLQFLGHSSISLRSKRTRVVVDPISIAREESDGGNSKRALMNEIRQADFLVISHNHWDHVHYQTLVGIPRGVPVVIPAVRDPTFSNPPLGPYLRSLGFQDIREIAAGDRIMLGDIECTAFPFYGEPFGIGSVFDGFTYYFKWLGRSLYGSVDACFDERRSMDESMDAIARMGPLDFFFFGSSDQHHELPYLAPGPRRLSNELKGRPELLRDHPSAEDVIRWATVIKPKYLVPYAQFLFYGTPRSHFTLEELELNGAKSSAPVESTSDPAHQLWLAQLATIDASGSGRLLYLEAMQGVSWRESVNRGAGPQ
jgi:hypothetical protein